MAVSDTGGVIPAIKCRLHLDFDRGKGRGSAGLMTQARQAGIHCHTGLI